MIAIPPQIFHNLPNLVVVVLSDGYHHTISIRVLRGATVNVNHLVVVELVKPCTELSDGTAEGFALLVEELTEIIIARCHLTFLSLGFR